MDEKIKDQEVLLVEEQKTESLRAVAGADEKDGADGGRVSASDVGI